MGKLIKNHLARLVLLTAAMYQVAAGLHGIFFPKIFFDVYTKSLDSVVLPLPALQTFNILFGLLGLAWEYPLPLIADTAFHRSIAARLALYPISVFTAILLYQGTNAAIYYLVGIALYFWAYSEGEVVCMPWKLPQRQNNGTAKV